MKRLISLSFYKHGLTGIIHEPLEPSSEQYFAYPLEQLVI